MTQSRFNPYHDWLGLERSPAHYYDLLGLPLWESDTERHSDRGSANVVIAAKRQTGGRQAEWKTLLDQLEAARDCLLAADQKARYDQRLRRKMDVDTASSPLPSLGVSSPSQSVPAQSVPGPDPMAPVELTGLVPATSATVPASSVPASTGVPPSVVARRPPKTRRRRKVARRSLTAAYALMAFSFLVVLVAFLVVMQLWILPSRADREQRQAQVPQSARDLPLPIDDESLSESVPPAPRPSARSNVPLASLPTSPPATEPLSRAPEGETTVLPVVDSLEINSLLRKAYVAIADRRWQESARLLGQASRLAGQSTLGARVARFAILNDYVQQYWQAFSDGLEDLQGSELLVQGKRVYVVEVKDTDLLIRIEGQNKRYAPKSMPPEIVMAIADRWFDQRSATTPVFRGAYMLVTPPHTWQDVRTAWQVAEQSGVQLGDLMQILDDLKSLGIAEPQ